VHASDVRHQPVEPGAELRIAAEALDRTKDLDERVLHDVFEVGIGPE
jgi:hypothetical protein